MVLKAVDNKEFDPDCTRSGRFKRKEPEPDEKVEAPTEDPKGGIIAKIYAKLHRRREGSVKSCCGRASAGLPAFDVHMTVPQDSRVRSLCGKCFPYATLERFRKA